MFSLFQYEYFYGFTAAHYDPYDRYSRISITKYTRVSESMTHIVQVDLVLRLGDLSDKHWFLTLESVHSVGRDVVVYEVTSLVRQGDILRHLWNMSHDDNRQNSTVSWSAIPPLATTRIPHGRQQ